MAVTGTDLIIIERGGTLYKAPVSDLPSGGSGGGVIVNTTSGTAFEFTGIPAEVQEIKILLDRVSLTASSAFLFLQLGNGAIDGLGYEATAITTTGSTGASNNAAAAFVLRVPSVSDAISGIATLARLGAGSNTWVFSATVRTSLTTMGMAGGTKTLDGELDRVRIVCSGGSTFDAGSLNVVWR
jgi:hypothetical protein